MTRPLQTLHPVMVWLRVQGFNSTLNEGWQTAGLQDKPDVLVASPVQKTDVLVVFTAHADPHQAKAEEGVQDWQVGRRFMVFPFQLQHLPPSKRSIEA